MLPVLLSKHLMLMAWRQWLTECGALCECVCQWTGSIPATWLVQTQLLKIYDDQNAHMAFCIPEFPLDTHTYSKTQVSSLWKTLKFNHTLEKHTATVPTYLFVPGRQPKAYCRPVLSHSALYNCRQPRPLGATVLAICIAAWEKESQVKFNAISHTSSKSMALRG